MENAIWITASITIAAVIGYVTNYLAIKMLFYPRQPWMVRGRRIPFTPGLIPKRKGEIAVSLGKVVSEYLVTADGLRSMLQQPELRRQIEQKLRELVEKWAASEETLEQIAVRMLGRDGAHRLQRMVTETVERTLRRSVRTWWGEDGTKETVHDVADTTVDTAAVDATPAVPPPLFHRPLSELVDSLQLPISGMIEREGVPRILAAVREELASPQGTRIIRSIVVQMVEGLGGMMGMLAGIFADEEKIAQKVRQGLLSYLGSQAAQEELSKLLHRQLALFGEQTPAQIVRIIRPQLDHALDDEGGRQSDADWAVDYISQIVPWQAWLGRLWILTPKMLLEERKGWLMDKLPMVADGVVSALVTHIEQVVRAVNLPKLVQEQVEKFPTEQVEKVILSITGREFKAITWLGAVLGGLIGILQALLYTWFG